MKKNGFIFVETIVAIIILTSSLLLLYSSFTNILQSEKTRIYYDDITYIYRTHFIANELKELNLDVVMNTLKDETSTKAFSIVGVETPGLCNGKDSQCSFFKKLLDAYEVQSIMLIKTNSINKLSFCNQKCALTSTDCSRTDYENCNLLYLSTSDETINFLKSLYTIEGEYILLVEYNTCNRNDECRSYYSWVGVSA